MEFQEFDVTRDRQALEELVETHGSHMTPTIVIGEQVIVGFDAGQLDEVLAPPPSM